MIVNPKIFSGSSSQIMIIGRTALESLTSMKCNFCQSPLSVPPIIIIKEDGSEHKCGRCVQVVSNINIRNVLFENIAKNIEFSCKYVHCGKKILWDEPIRNHELICPEKAINCPDLDCGQCLKQTEIGQHYLTNHDIAILHIHQIHINADLRQPSTSGQSVRCFFKDNVPYLSYLKYNFYRNTQHYNYGNHSSNGSIFFTLLSMIEPTVVRFTLTVGTSDATTERIIFEDQTIEHFDEQTHCSKCYLKPNDCRNVCHFQKNKQDNSKAKVVLEGNLLLNHWINSSKDIILTITLTDQKKKEALSSSFAPCLDYMKCPVCFLYLSLPIYTCKLGHSVCNVCKGKVGNCPICKSHFEGSRNFALENVIENIQVPCCYKENGCKFIGKPEKIQEHEKVCSKK